MNSLVTCETYPFLSLDKTVSITRIRSLQWPVLKVALQSIS